MDSSVAAQVISNSTFHEILDDLCVRFLMFLPEEELSSIERICFQIEEAHWYYEDFIREINTSVPNLHLKPFIHQILSHVPRSLISHIPLWKTETAFTDFMTYKTRVPVRGCIMLNTSMDKCVLVKGWKSGSSWSFPRGKIDQDEDDRDCAIREVFEETGFDLTGMVQVVDKIDINIREQDMRLYIAPGVPEDTEFAPRTRKEISKIAWHKLSELPGYSIKKGQREQNNVRQGRFFLVGPFIRELRKWIATRGKEWVTQQAKAAASKQAQIASTATTLTQVEEQRAQVEDDSAAGLKSLLGIQKPSSDVGGLVNTTEQDDASRRLKEMIGGKPRVPATNGAQHGSSSTLPENPNAKTLLSLLQSGPVSSPPSASHHSPPSHISSHPNFMAYPPAGIQPNVPSSSYQAPQPPQNGQPVTPMFQNSHPQVQPSSGWQQETPYPANQPNTYLPSPPPTSRYGPPPMMNQPPHHLHQRQSSFPPMSQLFPTPAMQAGSATSHRYGPQVHHPPPTPVDTLPPQPPILRSKPQDPGQAGALLSILKGTGPPPVAKSPPPTAPPSSAPQPKAPSPQQAAPLQQAPQPPPTATPPKRADRTVSNTLSNPISLQAPPPPRGPKAHTPQRHTSQRQRASMPGRPSTTVPPPQSYAPPSRPTTTQPSHKSPPPPLRRGTPVNIDHYGAQKPQNVPTTNFDRRKSVSGERAQTLLAMFKQPSSTSGSPVTSRAVLEEAVLPTDSPNLEKQGESPSPNRNFKDFVALEKERIKKKADMAHRDRLSKKADLAHRDQSSPEIENKKPAVPAPARLGTPSGGRIQKAKSPVGKDRAGLLAYLEDVANQGGGVSIC